MTVAKEEVARRRIRLDILTSKMKDGTILTKEEKAEKKRWTDFFRTRKIVMVDGVAMSYGNANNNALVEFNGDMVKRSHRNDNALVEFNGEMVNPANVRGISKKASGEASVAGAEELDDDDIDVANPQGGSGDDGMMPGLVDSFP